jgi:hypothetical protein
LEERKTKEGRLERRKMTEDEGRKIKEER